MSFIDDVIADRLRKLKGEVQRKLDEKEKKQSFITPSKTQVEQVESLLLEISEETALDSQGFGISQGLDEDIRARLDKLKTDGNKGSGSKTEDVKTRRSETIEEIVEKFRSLAELENKIETSLPKAPSLNPLTTSSPGEEPEEELPWCTICNEDATLRCKGCDNDLYCNGCYAEFHSVDDYKDHPKEPFSPPK